MPPGLPKTGSLDGQMSENLGPGQVDCVLFDFDGTLVDSREAVLRTFVEFAATLGVKATEQVIGRFDGLTTYQIVETAKKQNGMFRPPSTN